MNDEIRRKWCGALAKLCNPDNAAEAAAALTDMLPMLADVPDAVFASRSALDTVARWHRYTRTPSYADIRSALARWQSDNRPIRAALPAPRAPDRVEPSDDAKGYVRDLVAAFTSEVQEREHRHSAQMRGARQAMHEPRQLSRELLDEIYREQGLRVPGKKA